MKIHELVKSTGLVDKANQRGRWNGSKGNTSWKWHKGQKARSGHKYKWYHEGGQTPLVQRMPKARWFKRHFKLVTDITVINVGDLEKNAKVVAGSSITKDVLVSLWVISNADQKVKVLGNGDLSKSLSFDGVDYFSASAKEKITQAGWTVTETAENQSA